MEERKNSCYALRERVVGSSTIPAVKPRALASAATIGEAVGGSVDYSNSTTEQRTARILIQAADQRQFHRRQYRRRLSRLSALETSSATAEEC